MTTTPAEDCHSLKSTPMTSTLILNVPVTSWITPMFGSQPERG
ncbi:hypothetical protein [Psychrobacter sp. I-STPA6b]|nr:hypothetical protein [Psychrobacter sp. I-STPA6b]